MDLMSEINVYIYIYNTVEAAASSFPNFGGQLELIISLLYNLILHTASQL